nr:unnamed protein product [Digitaria exilis]
MVIDGGTSGDVHALTGSLPGVSIDGLCYYERSDSLRSDSLYWRSNLLSPSSNSIRLRSARSSALVSFALAQQQPTPASVPAAQLLALLSLYENNSASAQRPMLSPLAAYHSLSVGWNITQEVEEDRDTPRLLSSALLPPETSPLTLPLNRIGVDAWPFGRPLADRPGIGAIWHRLPQFSPGLMTWHLAKVAGRPAKNWPFGQILIVLCGRPARIWPLGCDIFEAPGALCAWPESGRHVAGVRRRPRRAGRAAATASPLPSHHVALDRPPCLAPRERHHGELRAAVGRALARVARSRSTVIPPCYARRLLCSVSHSLTRRSLSPNRAARALPELTPPSWRSPCAEPCVRPLPRKLSASSLAHFTISLPRAGSRRLQPPAARTELALRVKFTLVPPPFPNPSRTELDHFPSFLFPHFCRAIPNSPARNRIFPQIRVSGRRSTRTSSPYFEPSPRSTKHSTSFAESHWCSRTPPTPARSTTLAEIEPAAAAPHRHQSTRGEPQVLFPHFPDPLSSSFGRRNSGDEPRT